MCVVEAQRQGGRRPQPSQRGPAPRRPQAPRRGRQEGAEAGYAAPSDAGYSAPSDVPVYGAASDAVPVYGGASDAAADALTALQGSIPGIPGEDYPIYAEVPESGFTCDGQVDGGYYADPEAECQAFHICTADGKGGLAKYSFLCPNGTIFNQNYFICDWWFNFDCSTAEGLYSLNDELAAAREAASASADQSSYAAPADSYAAAGASDPALGAYEAAERAARKLGNRRNNRNQGNQGGQRAGRRFRG